MIIEYYFYIKRNITPEDPRYNRMMEQCKDFNRHLAARHPFLVPRPFKDHYDFRHNIFDFLPASIQDTITDENLESKIKELFKDEDVWSQVKRLNS